MELLDRDASHLGGGPRDAPTRVVQERRERALRGSPTLTRLDAMVASLVEDYQSIAAACARAGRRRLASTT